MLTAATDAHKGRGVVSMGVPNAFLQTNKSIKEEVERVIMKICGKLVQWLVEINPTTYEILVVI